MVYSDCVCSIMFYFTFLMQECNVICWHAVPANFIQYSSGWNGYKNKYSWHKLDKFLIRQNFKIGGCWNQCQLGLTLRDLPMLCVKWKVEPNSRGRGSGHKILPLAGRLGKMFNPVKLVCSQLIKTELVLVPGSTTISRWWGVGEYGFILYLSVI